MDWDVGIAKLLKERENKKYLGTLIGTVLEVEDDGITGLKVGLLDSQIILSSFWSTVKSFGVGENLLFSVSSDNQKFYCVGKVSMIDGESSEEEDNNVS